MTSAIYKLVLFVIAFSILLCCFYSCTNSGIINNPSKSLESLFVDLPKQELGICSNLEYKSKALLSSRFKNLDEFKTVVSVKYDKDYSKLDSNECSYSVVHLSYLSNGEKILKTMASGLSQQELLNLQKPDYLPRIKFVLSYPGAVRLRKDLETAYMLSRRKPTIFGPHDMSFYDLAEASCHHINTPDLAYQNAKDSSDQGYINTFNHITAQAIITSFFSQTLADFIGDLHERYNMPELTSGRFSEKQLHDSINNPVDNYVDLINNEIGQQIGIQLREKYKLNNKSICTPILLAAYLNDVQSYYMWALRIGMDNFRPTDEVVVKFSNKVNTLFDGSWIPITKAITGY